MTLFGNWTFADVIQLRCGRCNPVKMRVETLSPMTGVLRKREWSRNTEKTYREEGHVKMKTEIVVMLPPVPRNVDCWPLPKSRRSKEGIFLRVFRRSMALLTSWFQTSGCQNYGTINFCCFQLSSCGNSFWQPWTANTLSDIISLLLVFSIFHWNISSRGAGTCLSCVASKMDI